MPNLELGKYRQPPYRPFLHGEERAHKTAGMPFNALLCIFFYLNFNMNRFSSLLIILLLVIGSARAQAVSADTAKTAASVQDSTKRGASAGIDTVVNYSAKDSIIYSLRTRYMNLYGKSEMQFQTIGLKAERVNVNWDNATLIAHGIQDTVKADSVIGKPIMRDGSEEYKGDQVKYNFHTRK